MVLGTSCFVSMSMSVRGLRGIRPYVIIYIMVHFKIIYMILLICIIAFFPDNLRDITDYLIHAQYVLEAEDEESRGMLTDEHLVYTLFDVFGGLRIFHSMIFHSYVQLYKEREWFPMCIMCFGWFLTH